ncbi:hypothetical protein Cni_G24471 [Canna indica]|uniref:Uncharacterized protein n=1 Tax=Canna indica TaxID=4628 RepID=A0AAQ3QPL1_9LILI|nr:hypothetical protein Cni_G24471 [Canna indica]
MARLVLFSLLFLDLIATLGMARPMPRASAVTALELHQPHAPLASVSSESGESGIAGAPESGLKHTKQHKSLDKSVAGAEVILGGLATAIFVAVIAYIQVTRKRCSENKV